jgi:fructokinase
MILVCGEALFDVFVQPGETEAEIRMDARAGGSPFNVAIGLARLGTRAGMLTGLSTDVLGERLFGQLAREGVETRFLLRKEKRTTLSLVALGAGGAPAYTFYGAGSADGSLTGSDLPALDDSVKALHFGSYSLTVSPTADAFAALAAREARRFISLDPNIRLTVEPSLELWRRRVAMMIPLASLIKVSLEDIETLFPGEEPLAVARGWLVQGAALVVVTKGPEGVTAFREGERLDGPAMPAEVVDTVGAGDSFQAALLHHVEQGGLLSRQALREAPREALLAAFAFAARAAAITCGRRGADLPSRADMFALPG